MASSQKFFSLLALTLVLSSVLSGCGGLEERVVDMQQEMNDLQRRVEDLEMDIIGTEGPEMMGEDLNEDSSDVQDDKTTDDKEASDDSAKTTEVEQVALKEYPFESCGAVTDYTALTWYVDFQQAFQTVYPPQPENASYPSFTRLGQACYSSVAQVLIVVQSESSEPNVGFQLFKYDIKASKLSAADVEDYGFRDFAAPEEFGRRHGEAINLFGYGEDSNSCRITSSFNYNYAANQLYLTETCSQCPSEPEACTSY